METKPQTRPYVYCPQCGGLLKAHKRDWFYKYNMRLVAFDMDARGVKSAYPCFSCGVAIPAPGAVRPSAVVYRKDKIEKGGGDEEI